MNGQKKSRCECDPDLKECIKLACNSMFTKMSTKDCIKKFGATAVAAMAKEFTQLNEGVVRGKHVVMPTGANSLSEIEKKKAIRAVNLIK